jgi:PAS domain S-box-containing protein
MQDHRLTDAPSTAPLPSLVPLEPGRTLDGLVDVVCVLDGDGIFHYVSAASSQLFGYRPEEMAGIPCFHFIYPADIEKTRRCMVEHTLGGGPVWHFENRYRRKDGTLITVSWSGRWDAADGLLYCVARDGTAKSELEARLVKAQQIARVANYEFDVATQCYTYASDTLFDIFGIDRQWHPRFTSELFWSRVHPDDHERVQQSMLNPTPARSDELEYRIVHPDGRVVYIHRLREIVRDAEGLPLKTIGTLQDITARKLGEIERKRSEERLRALVQYGSDIIGILDAQGVYLFVGTNTGAHIGYSAEELRGRSVLEFIHPDDIEGVKEALQLIRTVATLTVGPLRYRSPDGTWRWIETTVSNHLDNPLIAGLITNSRDVTERKLQDDERRAILQRLEEQNRTIVEVLEQMRDGFITLSLDGEVLYWNGEAARITGISEEVAVGRSLWTLYPGMDQSPYYRLYRHLLEADEPIQETVFSPFSAKWFELRAYRTRQGITVFFRDVTGRKAAEEELQKLSLIARETTNPVIIYDRRQTVQWVNNAFLHLSGYTLEECVGRSISDICDGPGTDPEIVRYVQQQVDRCQPYRVEALNYKKNGDTYWSDVSCQPVFNEHGDVVQYFSIASDITERKALAQQLEREQRERQNKITAATLKAQEQERSAVSQELHDNVNQVLTTVKLYTEMVRDGVVDPEAVLDKCAGLLQDSINEIRSLSKRLSAPSLGRIRLADSVKELMDAVTATRKFAVELDTRSVADLEVSHDLHLAVYRILQEHLTNVLKHAGAGKVTVTLNCQEDHIHLRVVDDGKGFTPSRKHNGIGIANMITRAESLNGTLSLLSAPGKGCELVVSIPL